MKYFKFIVHLAGEGETENKAWDNAVKRFTDPKSKWQAHCSYSIEYENKEELLKNLFRDKSDEYIKDVVEYYSVKKERQQIIEDIRKSN